MPLEVSLDDLLSWREALANCAIEGNVFAQEQLELWMTDRGAFIREYIRQQALSDYVGLSEE